MFYYLGEFQLSSFLLANKPLDLNTEELKKPECFPIQLQKILTQKVMRYVNEILSEFYYFGENQLTSLVLALHH